MRLLARLPAKLKTIGPFPPPKARSRAGNRSSFLVTFVLFSLFVGSVADCEDKQPTRRFIPLHAPWKRGAAVNSTFEITVEGRRMTLRGDVVDNDLVSPPQHETDGNQADYDCILFAWSRSPLATGYEGFEIRPDGKFSTWQTGIPESANSLSSPFEPKIQISKTSNGFSLECEFVCDRSDASNSARNVPLYISLTQIDVSRGSPSSLWYCSSIPSLLVPERFHPSSFALLDSYPSDRPSSDAQSPWQDASFRIAEIELRNKWNRYASHPNILSLAQKWYEDLTIFPDAERFLERSRRENLLELIGSEDDGTPKRLTDARSETIHHLIGQSWSLHLSQIQDLKGCLPLSISNSTSTGSDSASDDKQNTSLLIWLESERLQIALMQNNDYVYWGSTSWPTERAADSIATKSISLASDGSTNGIGYELYANAIPLNLITHNANNLPAYLHASPISQTNNRSNSGDRTDSGDWEIQITSAEPRFTPQIDLYNTKLTPVEILSLEPDPILVSWSELTPEQREAWRLHYVFCVDPEGRYFLESLKHYTSSQAERLRRSKKPAKK
ncbi:MAG: hypothetical protein MUC43_11985 [Pirellula sp.]|jgi:hypothetical protein|nr:hypothetical protein [Pirellula sp.]